LIRAVASTVIVDARGNLGADAIGEKKLIRSEKSSLPGDQRKGDNDTTSNFLLATDSGKDNIKIPKQVVLTGPLPTFKDIFHLRRSANLFSWLGLSQDLYVRYFNDSHCRAYIERNYDAELTSYFDSEKFGSFRGDICRTAILAREGGFYIDLDMQLRVPLTQIVDDATTFMTARSYISGALNALIATTPENPVMSATLSHIRKWYRNETGNDDKLVALGLGPVTMERGLEEVIKKNCRQRSWKKEGKQFACGPLTTMRFYTELKMRNCWHWGRVMCPSRRYKGPTPFEGLTYGLFAGAKDDVFRSGRRMREQNFIGWTRAEDCHKLGCKVSGGLRYSAIQLKRPVQQPAIPANSKDAQLPGSV
jgi:hypothetical protein